MTVRQDGDSWTIWGLGVERDGKLLGRTKSGVDYSISNDLVSFFFGRNKHNAQT
ncbi:hypothetical protein [Vibrio sp. YQ_11]|uniref:hypothetical protein n=1 Tax=Vibrio sp. YQ_11 TaxID=3367233 RepID=UPI00370B8251